MPSTIIIDINKWNAISKAILTSKKDFEYTLVNNILDSSHLNTTVEIVFPKCLNKNERHIIHKYSLSNRLYSYSEHDNSNNSELHTILYKSYVSDLFVKYQLLVVDNKDTIEDIINDDEFSECEFEYSNDDTNYVIDTNNTTHVKDYKEVCITKTKLSKINPFTNGFIIGLLCGICLSEFIHNFRKLN